MKCFEDVNMVAVELFCSGGKCVYVCVYVCVFMCVFMCVYVCVCGGGGGMVRRRCREL